ncbi:hypothetical protein CCZ27_21620 [Thauera sinica]|nr:hypothetical protein CCZ27_21620 [Thauera sp. K11]
MAEGLPNYTSHGRAISVQGARKNFHGFNEQRPPQASKAIDRLHTHFGTAGMFHSQQCGAVCAFVWGLPLRINANAAHDSDLHAPQIPDEIGMVCHCIPAPGTVNRRNYWRTYVHLFRHWHQIWLGNAN